MTRVLDYFGALAAWAPLASDDVSASIASAEGPHGPAMRLDFDLAGTAGYAIARRALPLDLPPNYEISFYLRADAPVNNFQFKLVDASGDNVWWFNRPNVAFPREWQLVTIEKRQIAFAWGPTKDRTLNHVAAIEFVVSAGRGGGRGSVYLSELRLRELPSEAIAPALTVRPPSQMSVRATAARGGRNSCHRRCLPSALLPMPSSKAWRATSPRGTYPRGFLAEASNWTLVGVDGGSETGLLSEDGALEVAKGGFSIEPFVVTDSQVVTWADVTTEPFLVGDYLPMPGVTWHRPQWDLRVSSFASGSRAESQLVARYELTNHTAQPLKLTLVLAARPFQVNPPVQFLNTVGGVSPIHDAAWTGSALVVNGTREIFPLQPPDRAGVFSFKDGPMPRILAERTLDRRTSAARSCRLCIGCACLRAYVAAARSHDRRPRHPTLRIGDATGSWRAFREAMDRAAAGCRGRRVAREAQSRLSARSGCRRGRWSIRCERRWRICSSRATAPCSAPGRGPTRAPGSVTAR